MLLCKTIPYNIWLRIPVKASSCLHGCIRSICSELFFPSFPPSFHSMVYSPDSLLVFIPALFLYFSQVHLYLKWSLWRSFPEFLLLFKEGYKLTSKKNLLGNDSQRYSLLHLAGITFTNIQGCPPSWHFQKELTEHVVFKRASWFPKTMFQTDLR